MSERGLNEALSDYHASHRKAVEQMVELNIKPVSIESAVTVAQTHFEAGYAAAEAHYKMENKRLREALETIILACEEDFPPDEIVTDVIRVAREALENVA